MVKATTKKPVKKAAAKKSAAKKASVKKSAAKKTVRKAVTKKKPAKKTVAKKSSAKKAVAKKSTRKAPAKKAGAKKVVKKVGANQPLANHHRRRQALRRLCDGGDKGNETAGRDSQARCLRKGISRAAGCPTSHCRKQFSLDKMAAGSPVSRGARTLRSVAVTGQHGCCGLWAGSSSQGK